MLETIPLEVVSNDGMNEGRERERVAMAVDDRGRQRVE